MEKFISRYELAVILKSLKGEEGYSKLGDIIMEIQEKHGDIPELGGYGWWPLEDEEEVYEDEEGKEVINVNYAYQTYAELSTKAAMNVISLWYPNNKFFYDLNEEAIEILNDLRKRHGNKYRWRTIGKEVAKKKKYLHKIEFGEI